MLLFCCQWLFFFRFIHLYSHVQWLMCVWIDIFFQCVCYCHSYLLFFLVYFVQVLFQLNAFCVCCVAFNFSTVYKRNAWFLSRIFFSCSFVSLHFVLKIEKKKQEVLVIIWTIVYWIVENCNVDHIHSNQFYSAITCSVLRLDDD